jgi:hypothetical protein
MAELIPIGDTEKRQNRLIDVIFVHGFGGHPFKSWAPNEDQESDSMLHWLAEDSHISNVGIWTLKHESSQFSDSSRQSLVRSELASNLLQDFRNNLKIIPPDISGYRIVWVCHSEGGNVVKQLLRLCSEYQQFCSISNSILRASSNIYFIDTPHRGSWVANLAYSLGLRSVSRCRELREGDSQLLDLNGWYASYVSNAKSIDNFSFIQADSRHKVVGLASARLELGGEYFIDKDHNSIARPNSTVEEPYLTIHSGIKKKLEEMQPVASKPLRVKDNQLVNVKSEKRIWRLLIVAMECLGTNTRYRSGGIKFNITILLKSPDGSEQGITCDHDLSLDDLTNKIIDVYPNYEEVVLKEDSRDSKNSEDSDPILLVILFLPFNLFGGQDIYSLLSKMRKEIAETLASRTGLPLILACSSRYSLNGYDIPRNLKYSKSDLVKKSKEILRVLSADETPFSKLNWNLIHDNLSQSIRVDEDSIDSTLPLVLSQKLSGAEFDEICNSVLQGKSLEIDKLQDSHSFFLCWNNNTSSESLGRHPVRIQHLLNIGIPLMWIQDAVPDPRQSSGSIAEATNQKEAAQHADTMLGWTHDEFHDRFYRYNSRCLADGQQDELGIRRYIRNGILFWEDHRFLPRAMSMPDKEVRFRNF